MTKISKILTIFLSIACLAFAGFAIATTFAGPDWSETMQADYFDGYAITKSTGENASWSATRATDDGQVATSKVLPEVLTKIMDEVQQQQQTELQELQAKQPVLETRISELEKSKVGDEQALEVYIKNLRDRLSKLTQEESDLTSKVTAMAVEARKVESQIVSRREDIIRLNQQVEELKADLFRLKKIREQLQDLNFQLKEHLNRAAERKQSLNEKYSPMSR